MLTSHPAGHAPRRSGQGQHRPIRVRDHGVYIGRGGHVGLDQRQRLAQERHLQPVADEAEVFTAQDHRALVDQFVEPLERSGCCSGEVAGPARSRPAAAGAAGSESSVTTTRSGRDRHRGQRARHAGSTFAGEDCRHRHGCGQAAPEDHLLDHQVARPPPRSRGRRGHRHRQVPHPAQPLPGRRHFAGG